MMTETYIFLSFVVDKAVHDLDWQPKYSLFEGLKDSYENDFKLKKVRSLCLNLYMLYLLT